MKKALLILFLVSILAGLAAAGERFSVCPYGITVFAKDLKAADKAGLEKSLISALNSTELFVLVPAKEIKQLAGEIISKGEPSLEKAREAAEFSGIDFLVSGQLKGGKKNDEQLLDELFSEGAPASSAFALKLSVYDIEAKKTVYEEEMPLNKIGEAGKKMNESFKEFKKGYSRRRGRIVKIKDNKMAINLGAADGLKPDSIMTIYKEDPAVKIGKDLTLKPRGKKVIVAAVTRVADKAAIIEADSPADLKKIKEGYIVEYDARAQAVEPASVKAESATVIPPVPALLGVLAPNKEEKSAEIPKTEVKNAINIIKSGDF